MSARDFKNVLIPPGIAGIKSSLPPHTMAWEINRSFSISLALNLDWKRRAGELESSHLHYFCHFEDVELNWHLIRNKGDNAWFFSSRPMFDYLFLCNGEDIYGYFDRAVEAIRNNPSAGLIFPFRFDQLPKKENYYENILQTRYFLDDLHV